MARVFEKISDASTQWFDSLSERERRLMVVLFLSLCVILVLVTLFIGSNKLSSKRKSLEANKEKIAQVLELEGEYRRAKEKNERALSSIKSNRVSLFTFIQSATSRLGLKVTDLNEQKRTLPKSGIVEVSVRMNLSKLSLDKVTALIEAIETSEYGDQVKVTRLKINKRFDEPDLLDLQMTVSTWKSA